MPGSGRFTACLLLNSILGVKPTSIPFDGTGPALTALISGQVDYVCDQIVNVVQQVRAGHIKANVVGAPERGQQALAALVKREIERWTPIIKAAGPTNRRVYSQGALHICRQAGGRYTPPSDSGLSPPEDRSHAPISRLDRTHPRRRRGKARPHRDRH